ncbi:hypothetical protein BDZ91DRAFT_755447 [Kalaharituber pfeilii]|nr:hypothetical protein BDZ91DRAFT_755447 [Kalaharituber pfeilii]
MAGTVRRPHLHNQAQQSRTSLPSRSGPSLIVGVDFGTTYSGFAYVDTEKGARARIKTVFFNRDDRPKIPTRLCYCSSNSHPGAPDPASNNCTRSLDGNRIYNWGNLVDESCPHAQQFFKLQLDPGGDGHSNTGQPGVRQGNYYSSVIAENRAKMLSRGELGLNLSVEMLVQDFLSGMLRGFYAQLQQDYGPKYRDIDFTFEWVFTVPAFFSAEMIGKLREDVLPASGFRGTIDTLLEPEAAVTHVLFDHQQMVSAREANQRPKGVSAPKAMDLGLTVGNKIFVCDAGGGTTDLFSFQIDEMSTSDKGLRLQMAPLGEFAGQLFGSLDINSAFHSRIETAWQVIERFLNRPDDIQQMRESDIIKAMKDFERYKIIFDHSNLAMSRPISFESLGLMNIPEANVYNGVFNVSDELMRSCFDQVLHQLTDFVQRQLSSLEARGHTFQAMVFIGGLAASPYVTAKMKQWAESRSLRLITLHNKQETSAAVMLGAARSNSFGFIVTEEFDPAKHSPLNLIPEIDLVTGKQIVKGQIMWLIRKGNAVEPDPKTGRMFAYEKHKVAFMKGKPRAMDFVVVRCDDHDVTNLPPVFSEDGNDQLDMGRSDLRDKSYCRRKEVAYQSSRIFRKRYYETEVIVGIQLLYGGGIVPSVMSQPEFSGVPPRKRLGQRFHYWFRGRAQS